MEVNQGEKHSLAGPWQGNNRTDTDHQHYVYRGGKIRLLNLDFAFHLAVWMNLTWRVTAMSNLLLSFHLPWHLIEAHMALLL